MGREELLLRILMLIRIRSFQTSQQQRNETEHLKRQARNNEKITQQRDWIDFGVLAHCKRLALGWRKLGDQNKQKSRRDAGLSRPIRNKAPPPPHKGLPVALTQNVAPGRSGQREQ